MGKTKSQLIDELAGMKQRIAVLEAEGTERERLIREMRVMEDAIASSINAVALSDLEGKLTYVNDSFIEMWGYASRDEVLGKSVFDFWKSKKQVTSVLEATLKKRGARGELVALRKDGSTFTAEMSITLVINDDDRPLCVMGSFIDISERKRAEAALQQSEAKYRDLVENLRDVVYVVDDKGVVTYISPVVESFIGYSASELVNKPFVPHLHPDDVQRAVDGARRVFSGDSTTAEYRFITKSGEVRWMHTSNRPIFEGGRVIGETGILTDITERKRAEEELRLSEERYRSLVDIANECIVVVQDGIIKFANPKTEEATGYAAEELASSSFVDYLHPDDREVVVEAHERALKEGKAPYLEPFRMVAKNGDIRWLFRNTALIDWEGKPATLTFLSDVTERKRAEEALRESEEKYRSVVERASDLIVIIQDGKIRFANRRGIEMLGYTPEEAVGTPMVKYIHPDAMELALNHYQRRMAGEDVETVYESALLHKDGSRVDVEVNGAIINYNGKPADMAVIRDITERKQAEEALRDSEAKLRAMFEASPDFIMNVDREGKLLFINRTVPEMTVEQTLGTSLYDYIAPEAITAYRRALNKVFKTGKLASIETAGLGPGGRKSYYRTRFCPIIHDDWVNTVMIIATDYTEQKRAEEALRESEERFRTIIENARDAITIVDGNFTVLYESPSLEAVTGYLPEEWQGRSLSDMQIHPDDLPMLASEFERLKSQPGLMIGDLAVRYLHSDGTWHVIEASGRNFLDDPWVSGIVINFRDITDRRRMEEALRSSEEKLRIIFESIGDAITVTDLEGKVLDANRAAVSIFGLKDKEEAIGRAGFDFIAERSREKASEDMMKLFTERGTEPVEFIFKTIDGREFEVESNNALLRDIEGNPLGFVSINRDISQRKRAEEALRASEEKLRIMFDSITDGIVVTDLMGTIIDVNGAALRLHGYGHRKEMVGRKGLELISKEDQSMAIEKMFEGLAECHDVIIEYVLSRPDGTAVDVQGVVNLLHDSSGNATGLVVITRDITERKRAEENLKLYVAEITRAQEEERKRIARDLHDETVQELAALTLEIEAAKRADKGLSQSTVNALERIQDRSRSIMEGVNRFSAELRPDILDQMGLLSALSWLVENIGGDIDVRVESYGTERRLSNEVELAIFRVAQEALSNVRKHSEATKAVVKIAFTADGVWMEVRDYGEGFTLPANIANLAVEGHLGILGMHERARMVGGIASVRTRPGEGTSVSIVV